MDTPGDPGRGILVQNRGFTFLDPPVGSENVGLFPDPWEDPRSRTPQLYTVLLLRSRLWNPKLDLYLYLYLSISMSIYMDPIVMYRTLSWIYIHISISMSIYMDPIVMYRTLRRICFLDPPVGSGLGLYTQKARRTRWVAKVWTPPSAPG